MQSGYNDTPSMAAIVEAVTAQGRTGPATLADFAREALTLGGRLSLHLGLDSVSTRDRALLDVCEGNVLIPPEAILREVDRTGHLLVGLWPYGRLSVLDAAPADDTFAPAGWIRASAEQMSEVARRCAAAEALRADLMEEMTRFFENPPEPIADVVRRVSSAIDHMDQVLLYVEGQTFTNLHGFNNLLLRTDVRDQRFVLGRLAVDPVSSGWTDEQRKLVFSFYWLLVAGFRGEEFNGKQLHPPTVHAFLIERRSHYARRLQAPNACHDKAASVTIAALAAAVSHQRALLRREFTLQRHIHGLTFYKEERWVPRGRPAALHELPAAVQDVLAGALGAGVRPDAPLEPLLDGCLSRALKTSPVEGWPQPTSGVEHLLLALVVGAMRATRSHVGMTRGFRDFRAWQLTLDEGRLTDLCKAPITEYYCGVTADDEYANALGADRLGKVLVAIAKRMQYNGWHYTPGHFSAEVIPQGRHYFTPPQMADRAEWSDCHHEGHVLARVRYSIRVPQPIAHGGRSYPGIVDIRLMRAWGEPYTQAELNAAVAAAECVRIVCQLLCTRLVQGAGRVVFRSFEPAWHLVHAQALCARAARPSGFRPASQVTAEAPVAAHSARAAGAWAP